MKSESEIKKQLEEAYEYRLRLRIDRKTKRMCRNCKHGVQREFDLGDFGTMSRWECRDCRQCGEQCGFECRFTPESIEHEMIEEISDPSICGAKEPKIAVLMWVLHGGDRNDSQKKEDGRPESFLSRLKRIFS